MRYENLGQGSQFPYPQHDLPAERKDKNWCMQYAKAAYYDFQYSYPKGVFASNGGDYEKWRMYALGKQPVSIYKKMLGVDQQTNNTWLSIDWSVRAVVSGYRDKAISRLMKEDYGVVATPIDMLAKTEQTEYYSDMKAKLMVREMMIKQNPEMASHPLIQLQSGEPMDLEEMQMRVELGEQFNRSKDAEMAIELGLYENNYKTFRRAIYEDLFDYGVAGCKDWLGDDNKAKFRKVNPERVVVSFCKDYTFKDMVHAGAYPEIPPFRNPCCIRQRTSSASESVRYSSAKAIGYKASFVLCCAISYPGTSVLGLGFPLVISLYPVIFSMVITVFNKS